MGGQNVVQIRDGETRDTLEQWYEDEMFACGYRGQPEIMRTLVARGADTVLWFQNLGLVWRPLAAGALRPPIRRGIGAAPSPNYPGTFGIAWTTVMKREVDKLGVPVLLNHRMTRVHRPDPNGPVLGIEVEAPQGIVNIRARKAVILCTGTWTDNYRMAAAWDPRISGPDTYGDGGTPCDGTLYVDSAGDGHLAAAEIGAGFSDMSFVSYLYTFLGSRSYWGWSPLESPTDWTKPNVQGGQGLSRSGRLIYVNNSGVRWVNEAVSGPSLPGYGGYIESTFVTTYLSLPQPRNVWGITDADGVAAMNWPEADIRNPNPRAGRMLDPACLAIADSLPQLAGLMGIPPAALATTITRYNGFVDANKDDDFGKPSPLFKVEKPPFFAGKLSLIRHTQRNGLRVNTKSQVLQQSDQRNGRLAISIDQEQVIPHLYAAGECGNSLGFRRPHNSLAHYVTAARIAGENAAREIPLG